MNDPSCFTNLHEYYTFIYAISYMMLVEVGIWILFNVSRLSN